MHATKCFPGVIRGVRLASVRTVRVSPRCCGAVLSQWWRGPSTRGVARTAATATTRADTVTRLSFSGCGWLLPFHIGVAQRLIDAGVLPHGSAPGARHTCFAGASGGALIAAALACGVAPADMMAAGVAMASYCRKHGTVARVREPLDHAIRSLLPADALERLHAAPDSGAPRLQVAVTRLEHDRRYRMQLLRPLPVPLATMVSEFDSRDDLVEALLTSSHVPFYLTAAPATRFRGEWCFDGGLADPIPRLPGFVTVTMLPLFKADISPSLLSQHHPQQHEQHEQHDQGSRHDGAERFGSGVSADTCNGNADVAPDFGPTTSIPRLLRAAFIPGTDAELWGLHAWGMAAAGAWLRRSGAAAAAGTSSARDNRQTDGAGDTQLNEKARS